MSYMNYYPKPVSEFTDAELVSLAKEIEDAGILQYDCFDWPEGSWQEQAEKRWDKIIREQRRRAPLPRSPGLDLSDLDKVTKQFLSANASMEEIFKNDICFKGMKRS